MENNNVEYENPYIPMEQFPKLRSSKKSIILKPNPLTAVNTTNGKNFEHECVYNPAAIVRNDIVHLLYRAENKYGRYVSAIGLATSRNGVHFERYGENPVLAPTVPEECRGCEDPRITEIHGTYHMFYTAFAGTKGVGEALAISEDLIHWTKKGVVVPNRKSFTLFPEKIDGKYCALVGDTCIFRATSYDLLRWDIELEPFLLPREDSFDSYLVEPGPPPFAYEHMWCVIYNSCNKQSYNVGYCFLDKENPRNILYRSNKPLLSPTCSWEKFGKVNNVVFASGLVKLKTQWLLYYGGADKVCGVTELLFIS